MDISYSIDDYRPYHLLISMGVDFSTFDKMEMSIEKIKKNTRDVQVKKTSNDFTTQNHIIVSDLNVLLDIEIINIMDKLLKEGYKNKYDIVKINIKGRVISLTRLEAVSVVERNYVIYKKYKTTYKYAFYEFLIPYI